STPALVVQTAPPDAGPTDPHPLLSHNSLFLGDADYNTFTFAYRRKVTSTGATTATVSPGVLQAALSYSAKDANGYYLPRTQAINALKQETNGTWTETQSDGVQFRYDASGALLW